MLRNTSKISMLSACYGYNSNSGNPLIPPPMICRAHASCVVHRAIPWQPTESHRRLMVSLRYTYQDGHLLREPTAMGIVSDIPLRQFVPEAQSPSALETPSMTDGPVAVGSAPTLVTVGKGCKARPVEVGEVAASSPPGKKSAKPPASLEEAAPTAVTFGWVGAKRVLCVSSSSSGSGVSALG